MLEADKKVLNKLKEVPVTLSTILVLLGGGGGSLLTSTVQGENIHKLESTIQSVNSSIEVLKDKFADQNLKQQREIYLELHEINKRLSRLEGKF